MPAVQARIQQPREPMLMLWPKVYLSLLVIGMLWVNRRRTTYASFDRYVKVATNAAQLAIATPVALAL
jgi:hypothetical protein